jgi:hypothetical protein
VAIAIVDDQGSLVSYAGWTAVESFHNMATRKHTCAVTDRTQSLR